MELKSLGNTGWEVPEIGLGTWRYQGGVEPLRQGIELGASFIDTAEVYDTEDVVGKAVAGIREQVFIATKVSGGHLHYEAVLRAAETSLRQLRMDCIDLYQIHWPNARIPIKETMRAMETLVDRGQIKFIGVSNFSLSELRDAQAVMSKYPIVSNQVLYNLNRRNLEYELLPYCQEQQITVIAYTPLDDGRLAGVSRARQSRRAEVLEQLAAQRQKSPAQVALNWLTSHPDVITIPKSNSRERVVENCGASGWRLTQDQIQLLNATFS